TLFRSVQLVEGAAGLTWPDAAGTPWMQNGAREAVEIVPASAAPEAAPEVSVTALVHFAECPRRHFLGNVSGWPDLREGELSTGAR
ncbi:MAG TPA: hypothetical protein DCY80_17580, partial [Solibacterales bacterium]|nr:hypothetical protein [Bryobacterales bacterium]